MKWLILAVLVFAQQPPKAPEGERIAKSNNANSTRSHKPAKAYQNAPAPTTPVSPEVPIGPESKRFSSASDNKIATNNQQTSEEDRAIQRKLVWFTGALAVFAFFQLVVMLLQWGIYKRQAREMRRSRHEMRRQRHVMFGQYKAMRDQIAQTEQGGKQTAELIKQASTQSGLMALAGTHTETL